MRLISLLAVLMSSTAAFADDAAVLLGAERYSNLDRLIGGSEVAGVAPALTAVGFVAQGVANPDAAASLAALQRFVGQTGGADRLIVALSGHFMTDGARSWFLPVDAAAPSIFAMSGAVSVDSVMQVMSRKPGQGVLVLGYDAGLDDVIDPFVVEGLGDLVIPQGVTVVTGTPAAAADFLAAMATPGADIMTLVRDNRRLSVAGYAPGSLVLVPPTARVTPPAADEDGPGDLAAETALWEGARALDTEAAYRNYLSRYPAGRFAAEAEALIAEITTEPNRAARLVEDALGLNRDAMRDIQRDLTLLDFDPRGIDGIFGPGTRNAITNWQQQNGYSQTTYLTAEQINRLDAQAARRGAELEAAAERARAEQLRLDRAYWQETGARADEPGLRAYLDRYPDGTFAAQAAEQLAAIEDAKRAAAAAEDTAAWEAAVAADTVAAYESYLQAFPNGALIAEAQARIDTLLAPSLDNDPAAIEGEAALGLTPITFRLIEARLQQLGLEPGAVDGSFDDSTRRAVRNFQRDRELTVTGYLNEETIVRLLADATGLLGD